MKTYQFDPEKLKKQTKILILMYSIPLVLMLILVFFLNRNRPEMMTQTIILVVLMVGFYAFMGFRRYKQNVQLWKEYALTVDEDGVSQTQPNFPQVRIPKEEISGIEVVKNGFYVQTRSQGRVLGVSRELSDSDYDELKQIFSTWAAENELNQPWDAEDLPEEAELSIGEKADHAFDSIDAKLVDAETKVENVIHGAESKIEDAVETVKDKAHDAKDKAGEVFESVKEKAEDVFDEAKEKAEEIIETVKDKAHDAKDKIEDTISEKVEDIKDAFHTDGDNK